MQNTFNHCFITTIAILLILLLEKPSQQKVKGQSNPGNRGLLELGKNIGLENSLIWLRRNTISMNQEKKNKTLLKN